MALQDTFQDELLNRKTWQCSFPEDVLNVQQDIRLYEDDPTIFLSRRSVVRRWLRNSTEWAEIIYGASKELANDDHYYSRLLQQYNMLEALRDFIVHTRYFHEVSNLMNPVFIKSQNYSVIHDIDKLDPVMLAGYSERFEDNKKTSLWDRCVYRHTHINPHHQQHYIWQDEKLGGEVSLR